MKKSIRKSELKRTITQKKAEKLADEVTKYEKKMVWFNTEEQRVFHLSEEKKNWLHFFKDVKITFHKQNQINKQ